jgi:1,4-dihydroxy-6-naphthoate synthase
VVELRLGHTPDADDAFMFYGIASGKVNNPVFEIKHVIEDIETLNKRALHHELDVTAISAHAYAYLRDYVILSCGASFGLNYGPVIISKKRFTIRTWPHQDCRTRENDLSIPDFKDCARELP